MPKPRLIAKLKTGLKRRSHIIIYQRPGGSSEANVAKPLVDNVCGATEVDKHVPAGLETLNSVLERRKPPRNVRNAVASNPQKRGIGLENDVSRSS